MKEYLGSRETQVPASGMTFHIGERIGAYEILGLLGAGGMGRVYRVRNDISGRVEAMKILLPDLLSEPLVADRFLHEIRTLAGLEHPNIAQLRTAFKSNNQLIMIMEYVEGQRLEDRLQNGPVPVFESLRYMSQALAALAYAHERGVIHRDIKPANMILTPSRVLKLMDFGIAKSKQDIIHTAPGTTLGSLFYMSPEQVLGTEVDARSDLYSLGISLYELVTGKRPFGGNTSYEILNAQVHAQPEAPRLVNANVPAKLNDLIMMAIAKDPAHRFQTAQAFARALETIHPEPAQDNIATVVNMPTLPITAPAIQLPPSTPVPRPAPPTPVPSPVTPLFSSATPVPPAAVTVVKEKRTRGWRGWLILAIVLVATGAIKIPHFWDRRNSEKPAKPPAVQTTPQPRSTKDTDGADGDLGGAIVNALPEEIKKFAENEMAVPAGTSSAAELASLSERYASLSARMKVDAGKIGGDSNAGFAITIGKIVRELVTAQRAISLKNAEFARKHLDSAESELRDFEQKHE